MGERHHRPLQILCNHVAGKRANLVPIIVRFTLVLGVVFLLTRTGIGILKAQNTLPQAPAKAPETVPVSPGILGLPGSGPAFSKTIRPFACDIDPKTPLKELLPVPPKDFPGLEPLLDNDLTKVPELCLEDTTVKAQTKGRAMSEIGMATSKINFLNKKKKDGFLLDLLANRLDLQGLPFLLGNDCKLKPGRNQGFKIALDSIRLAMTKNPQFSPYPFPQSDLKTAKQFAKDFNFFDSAIPEGKNSKPQHDEVNSAGVAALIQVFGPDTQTGQYYLVNYLAKIPHVDATKALAKFALFSPHEEVRDAAIDYLKGRREKDYIHFLMEGFRYPWPEVADRAKNALAKLQPDGVVSELVDLLEESDPRLPQLKTIKGEEVYVAKQLVRINHHKNCLLCHAPATLEQLTTFTVTAPIPRVGEPLPPLVQYYATSPAITLPELSVRVDVTYLRQDFSLVQKVPKAKPWPELQRFDFLVRSVQLTKEQADDYGAKIKNKYEKGLSPYQSAVLSTLQSLTGQQAGTTAPEWRKALKLSG